MDVETSGALRLGRTRLAVVVVLLAGLLVQGAYSFLVTPEPYPAVRMPSFQGAPDADGMFPTTALTITVEYQDGQKRQVGVEEFMEPFRTSSARGSADHVFKPENNTGADRPAQDPAVVDFVRERAEELGAGKTPVAVDFCYQKADLDVHTGEYVDPPACDTTRVAL